MVKLLKDMIYIEGKDKEFLLANITRVTQENGKYLPLIVSFWLDWAKIADSGPNYEKY